MTDSWNLLKSKLGQTPGDSEGQGILVCCSPWIAKRHDLATGWQQQWLIPVDVRQRPPQHCKAIKQLSSDREKKKALVLFFVNHNLWPPHAKSWLTGKDSDAGRDWGQEEKETTEDEMVGWHHWLDGRESEWTPGVGDGQGGLACCNSWGRKELDTTEWLIWSDIFFIDYMLKL